MVGHKLGEFVPTRTFKAHSSNNKAEDSAKEAAGTAIK
jgi:ribosomal protein S19